MLDVLFDDASAIVQDQNCDISFVRKKFNIDKIHAAKILNELEIAGVIHLNSISNSYDILIKDDIKLRLLLNECSENGKFKDCWLKSANRIPKETSVINVPTIKNDIKKRFSSVESECKF